MFTALYLVILIIGLVFLIKSTEVFIDEAVNIFTKFNVSYFVIGALVIGFGTSLPELGVGAIAALNDNLMLSVSSAVGSNVANIAFILGFCMLVFSKSNYIFKTNDYVYSAVFLVVISGLLLGLSLTFGFVRITAIVFLTIFILYLIKILLSVKKSNKSLNTPQSCANQIDDNDDDPVVLNNKENAPVAMAAKELNNSSSIGLKSYLILIVSLVILIVSSQTIVWQAENLADLYQIRQSIIGATIIALGSSLPELVSSISAMKKNNVGLVIGNVIGSNTMNTLLVIAVAVFIAPAGTVTDKVLLNRDMPISLALSVFLLLFLLISRFLQTPSDIKKQQKQTDLASGLKKRQLVIKLIGAGLTMFYLFFLIMTSKDVIA